MSTFLTEEDSTSTYTARLVDENDIPIPGSDIDPITVTLYDDESKVIINSRDKSTIGLSVGSDGRLVWLMAKEDNPIIDNDFFEEKHRALFEFTWAGGARNGEHEVSIRVRNFEKV